ncbi:MAG: response regulator [Mariprofundus sp.]|nr:response regulator [Mariprofundus sp.]
MAIYIVDDNPDVCEFLAFLLSSDGHRVYAFCNPEDALSHMKNRQIQPCILITDYNMPHINGYELHQQVCQHAPAVKTIVISGRTDARRLIGNLHFLQKPFPPDHVIKLVEALKESRQASLARL